MNEPDGGAPPEGGSNRGLLVVGIIALAIVVAAIAFGAGRLTAPSEEVEAAPTTTSAPPVVVESTGEPLDWSEAADIGEAWPVGLVEHEGNLFLFASPGVPYGEQRPEGSGLDAWASADGAEWAAQGTVIEAPALVFNVTSTPRGLVAMGRDADDRPMIWTSPDGEDWSARVLPDPRADQLQTIELSAAGANEEAIVVFGNSWFDPDQLILDAVGAADFQTYGMSYGPGGPFTLYGPLGIPVVTVTAEEIGLSDEQLDLLFAEQGPQKAIAWTSADGATWSVSELDADHIMSVSTDENGDLVALGYGPRGMESWTSPDGIEWTSEGSVGDIDQVVAWGDGFVGISFRGPTGDIVYSDDGTTWEPFGLGASLPPELEWNFFPLSAGPAGVATVAHGFDPFMEFEEPGAPEPIELERNGHTLIVDEVRGLLNITQGDTEVVRLFLHTEQPHDEIAVDFAARTMTFLHPDTGEELMTFTFDELEDALEAQYESVAEVQSGREPQVLLFSTDGADWSTQDLAESMGDGVVQYVHVMDDRVVALVAEYGDVPVFGVAGLPSVKVWTGFVP